MTLQISLLQIFKNKDMYQFYGQTVSSGILERERKRRTSCFLRQATPLGMLFCHGWLGYRQNKQCVELNCLSKNNGDRNKTLLLFPEHTLSSAVIRIWQVTVTLLDHLQMEPISYQLNLIWLLSACNLGQVQLAGSDLHLAFINQAELDHLKGGERGEAFVGEIESGLCLSLSLHLDILFLMLS